MEWQSDKPWNGLPPVPPEGVDLESKSILKQCIRSRAALAALNEAAKLIPNQRILMNMLLLEAEQSSAIENIVTTTDNLFQYAAKPSEKADPYTREAARYRTALQNGIDTLDRGITINLASEVCSTIKDTDMDVRKIPGIKLSNSNTGEIIYTPPDGEQILQKLLRNWELYLSPEEAEEPSNQDETEGPLNRVDPLIRMAVGHYQFEAIHPFTDGNGRTGRIMNSLYLVQQKLLDQPILNLSRYILDNKEEYYELLRAVTADARWEEWILYILKGVAETSKWTVEKIRAINELQNITKERIKEKLPKVYNADLLEILFTQPYCRITNLVENEIAKRQTAAVYLKKLTEIDVLEEKQDGRDKYFLHLKLMELLRRDDNKYEPYPI